MSTISLRGPTLQDASRIAEICSQAFDNSPIRAWINEAFPPAETVRMIDATRHHKTILLANTTVLLASTPEFKDAAFIMFTEENRDSLFAQRSLLHDLEISLHSFQENIENMMWYNTKHHREVVRKGAILGSQFDAGRYATLERLGIKRNLYIALLCVSPVAQGRGIGGTLLRHVLNIAENKHLPIFLDSSPAGLGMYLQMGFEEVGTIEIKDGDRVIDRQPEMLWKPPHKA